MVVLGWLYLNSIAILIGFELNLSIIDTQAEDAMWLSLPIRSEETA